MNSSLTVTAVFNLTVLPSASQFISAAQGGTITLSDGSSVTIPPGALASNQTVTLQLVAALPQQPPGPFLTDVGPGLLLTLPSPNTSATPDRSAGPGARPEASIFPGGIGLTLSVPQTALAVQGAGGISYLTDTSGNTSAIGTSTTYNAATNAFTLVQDTSLLGSIDQMAFGLVNITLRGQGLPAAGARVYVPASGGQTASWAPDVSQQQCPTGNVLVLVHGMDSTVENAFPAAASSSCGGVAAIQAAGNYSSVVGFDYDWTQHINSSGSNLAGYLDFLGSCASVTSIDIEAHSEGVPVSGSAIGQANPAAQQKFRNFIALGGPIAGTPVASFIAAQQALAPLAPIPALTTVLGGLGIPVTGSGYTSVQAIAAAPNIQDMQTGSSVLQNIWKNNQFQKMNMFVACGNTPDFSPKVLASVGLTATNDELIPLSSCLGTDSGLLKPPVNVGPAGGYPLSHTKLECDANIISAVGQAVANAPPAGQQYTLTASGGGTGQGKVSQASDASTPGTPCGANCLSYPAGAKVTLTANAASGSTFTNWSGGGCSGNGACVVTMNSDLSVTAIFTLVPPPQQYNLTFTTSSGSGSGVLSSPTPSGTSCGAHCWSYPAGQSVTLTANPSAGSTAMWSVSGCSGDTCVVQMDSNISVTVAFTLGYTYTDRGTDQSIQTQSTSESGCTPSPYVSQSTGSPPASLVVGTPLENTGSFSGTLTFGAYTSTTTYPALTCTLNGTTVTSPASIETGTVPGGAISFSGTSDGHVISVSQATQNTLCTAATTCSVSSTVSVLAENVVFTLNVAQTFIGGITQTLALTLWGAQ
jgi:hypothetical protein